MTVNPLTFLRGFRQRLAQVKAERAARENAIRFVLAHPQDFVGSPVQTVIDLCGEPDSAASLDFGHSVALWRPHKGAELHVFVFGGKCTEIRAVPS